MAATTDDGSSRDLTTDILVALSKNDPVLSAETFPDLAFVALKAALDRLASRSMIVYTPIERDEAILEPEGEQIAQHGSHEARVFEALRQAVEGLTVAELEKAVGDKNVTKMGQGKAFKEKWISKGKDGKLVATVCATAATPSCDCAELC
jgi:phenylalanyl-tRNA synthetase alpha chain